MVEVGRRRDDVGGEQIDDATGADPDGRERRVATPPLVDADAVEPQQFRVPGERTVDVGHVQHQMVELSDLHDL